VKASWLSASRQSIKIFTLDHRTWYIREAHSHLFSLHTLDSLVFANGGHRPRLLDGPLLVDSPIVFDFQVRRKGYVKPDKK